MGMVVWAVPLLAILAIYLTKDTKTHHIISIIASGLELFITGILTSYVMNAGEVEYDFLGGLFYVDSLSIILLDLVTIISMLVAIYNIGYLNHAKKTGELNVSRIKLFYMLLYGFIFTMVFVLTVKNMGLIWIAVEAKTLASTFLVGFHNDKRSIEAAWKYVIICSVGIAIAMLGIVFLHISSLNSIAGNDLLDWTALYAHADSLNGSVLRFAFLFILVGFGTKAGLAPMHTWLPDAHSQAPSPVSAMLSGLLLNTSLYPIIRVVSIVNKNTGGSSFTGRLLIAIGLISLATAAIFIITQKDYKRLLAYSSIEHIGVVTIAIGVFTPAAVFGALLHMINHSFTKSMLFLASGNILQKYGTRKIDKVRNLIKVLPFSGPIFFIGLFAIGGTPPFSIFASEFSILMSIFDHKNFVLGISVVALLTLAFVGITATLFRLFYGENAISDITPGETNPYGAAVLLLLLGIISITGLLMPQGIMDLILEAQNIITGSI
jgi:hydrogenase-4 component F